jgi:TonB family protein
LGEIGALLMKGKTVRCFVIGLSLMFATVSMGVAQGYDPSSRIVRLVSLKTAKEGAGHGYWMPGVLPIYPFQMALAGISGFAEVRLVVGEDGRIKETSVVASSQKAFEEPALQAVRSWRFAEIANPITKKRVGTVVDCRFEFSIDQNAERHAGKAVAN